MGRLFGTDGARGVANTELTPELAMAIGRAAAMVLTKADGRRPKVLIGKDTRASSDMLEAALTAGLCSVGADAVLLGVVPTPAVAYLVSTYQADAGVMISASHNPCEYNGIKLFNGAGFKLRDELETEMEAIVMDQVTTPPTPTGGQVGRVTRAEKAVDDYVRHLVDAADCNLAGMKIAVDCANGSASATAKKLFAALGAEAVIVSDAPDGENINRACGSTHMDQLVDYVKTHKVFGGVAFDGDADRCLAVDEQGNLIDGDQIMAALALSLKQKGELAQDTVVATVMSNLGFVRYCEANGITPLATKVGDRYVLEKMEEEGYVLGGEQSGHIILRHYATTGDGQLSAVKLLCACREQGVKLSRLCGAVERYPQVLINVKADAAGKAKYQADAALQKSIADADAALGKNGRVLVRVSGTEPLVRVMVEGKEFDEINRIAVELGESIKRSIGEEA